MNSKETLHILLSNDDGIESAGLHVLAQTIRTHANTTVVAPDRDCSGTSSALTLTAPIKVVETQPGWLSVQGTPTDCVHIGITGLLEHQPDMVISGINIGANLGDDAWYSGTVAAAVEGRFLRLPAIAVSLVGSRGHHLDTAAQVVATLFESIKRSPLPAGTILNVNVPDVPFEDLTGFETTRCGRRRCAEPTQKALDPRGHVIYWIGPAGVPTDAGPGTDFYAIEQGRVSITPLCIDLTDYQAQESVQTWLSHLQTIA